MPTIYEEAKKTQNNNIDYSDLINRSIQNGGSAEEVQGFVNARKEKIAGDSSLSQYSNDSVFQNAERYINSQKSGNQYNPLTQSQSQVQKLPFTQSQGQSQSQTQSVEQIYNNGLSVYADAQKGYEEYLAAQVKKKVEELNAYLPEIQKRYENANAGAHNTYLNSVNPFGTRAQNEAKMGLANSGYSETTKANLGNSYQGAINTNETQKNEQIAEIEREIERAKLEGNMEKARAWAAYGEKVAGMNIDMGNAMLNASISQNKLDMEKEQIQRQNEWDEEQRRREVLVYKAEVLASRGDFSGYKDLGFSDEQIRKMDIDYKTRQAVEKMKSYPKSVYKPTLTAEQAKKAYLEGNTTETVINAYKYYYGDPDDLNSDFKNDIAKGFYESTQRIARERNRAPSPEDINVAIKYMISKNVPEIEIDKYLHKLGIDPQSIYNFK